MKVDPCNEESRAKSHTRFGAPQLSTSQMFFSLSGTCGGQRSSGGATDEWSPSTAPLWPRLHSPQLTRRTHTPGPVVSLSLSLALAGTEAKPQVFDITHRVRRELDTRKTTTPTMPSRTRSRLGVMKMDWTTSQKASGRCPVAVNERVPLGHADAERGGVNRRSSRPRLATPSSQQASKVRQCSQSAQRALSAPLIEPPPSPLTPASG